MSARRRPDVLHRLRQVSAATIIALAVALLLVVPERSSASPYDASSVLARQ